MYGSDTSNALFDVSTVRLLLEACPLLFPVRPCVLRYIQLDLLVYNIFLRHWCLSCGKVFGNVILLIISNWILILLHGTQYFIPVLHSTTNVFEFVLRKNCMLLSCPLFQTPFQGHILCIVQLLWMPYLTYLLSYYFSKIVHYCLLFILVCYLLNNFCCFRPLCFFLCCLCLYILLRYYPLIILHLRPELIFCRPS